MITRGASLPSPLHRPRPGHNLRLSSANTLQCPITAHARPSTLVMTSEVFQARSKSALEQQWHTRDDCQRTRYLRQTIRTQTAQPAARTFFLNTFALTLRLATGMPIAGRVTEEAIIFAS